MPKIAILVGLDGVSKANRFTGLKVVFGSSRKILVITIPQFVYTSLGIKMLLHCQMNPAVLFINTAGLPSFVMLQK